MTHTITAATTGVKRNREIDFLRGIAILFVILFHDSTIPFFKHTGWMGVDLFFVLSGFLVSGLLFKEKVGAFMCYNFTMKIKSLTFDFHGK